MAALPKQFETYLRVELNVSGKTLRNYRADLLHFTAWAITHLSSQGQEIADIDSLLPHFSQDLVASYKSSHVEAGVPHSTTNRRLSTLRNFGKFLAHAGVTSDNPVGGVTNLKQELSREEKLSSLINEFSKHLAAEKISKVTSKNYLSDVRHFMAWLSKQEDWIQKEFSPLESSGKEQDPRASKFLAGQVQSK